MQSNNESDEYLRIIQILDQITDQNDFKEIISDKITQKTIQKTKTLSLQEECPTHEQEITMIILGQECQRKRLICVDCIEDSQQQGMKKIVSIKRANQEWKNYQERLLESVNNVLKKRDKNILLGQNILQKQYGKFCLQNQELKKIIGQSGKQIQIKQKTIIQEKSINLQDLESNDLLNRINFLVSLDKNKNQITLIEDELNKDDESFLDLFKEYSVFLDQIKKQYEQEIFQLKENQISDQSIQYFQNMQNIQNRYPNNLKFELEEFNAFDPRSFKENQETIYSWSDCMENSNTFKQFAQIFINCIKRNNSSSHEHIVRTLNKRSANNFWNSKSLFQILYNNSSVELQYTLLRNYGQYSPLPLIYQNSTLEKLETIKDFFILNKNLFHVFPECFPIINFSLSNNSSSYGKTQLINEIFYKRQVFEVKDQSVLNLHTIDIMFDYCFNKTRSFAIADAHGIVPFEILIKILPLFKLWIIQMNTEDELQENFEQFQKIKKQIKIPDCCFIVRNQKSKDLSSKSQLENLIQSENIQLHKIIDLTQKHLDQQTIFINIEQASKFIFDNIRLKQHENNLVNSQNYLGLIYDFYGKNNSDIKIINTGNLVLLELREELNNFLKDPLGFYSMDAFPMGSLMWQIKNYRKKQFKFDGLSKDQQVDQVEKIKHEISTAENQIPFVKPTLLLELFQEIFQSEDYYILYLKFTDQIREFNELNIQKLQEENQQIQEMLYKIKQEKKKLNQQIQVNDKQKNIEDMIKKLNKSLDENLKAIEMRNICIELFWREIIYIKQRGQRQLLQMNPAEIVAKMVKKGEPFEFLNDAQQQIDKKFLLEVIKQYSDHDNEKILILSILGPQSSGKSTILNKIFGCHFQTRVGSCTKGIYLQLLKITQKSYFDDKFDYVLILDSEGLQNPNQNDPEFDKQIALFILAISDIILINVKGDIHSQFKNLVEMCIFTLGQMKSSISAVKQLSWCFNQNNDCKNFAPFLQQIQGIVNTLILEINKADDEGDTQSFDYNEVLDLKKESIKILGFASTEQSWRINPNTGIYEEWRQQLVNETFSEEAYSFGIQMILQYVQKHNAEQNYHLPSLFQFIQNIESTWQSICRLPDLLEFTELLQYKHDQFMKAQYESIYSKYPFDYPLQITSKIQAIVLKEKKKNLEFFIKIEVDEKRFIEQEKEKIKTQIEEEIQKFKQVKQIQNKICKKYLRILGESLQTYEYNCHLALFDEIKKHKNEFQQKKGFTQIEDYIAEISQKSEILAKYKSNKQLMEEKFNELWKDITKKQIENKEEFFSQFSASLYNGISSSFAQYQYKTTNFHDQYSFFFNICKDSPKGNTSQEKEKIFDFYFREVIQKGQYQQFQLVGKYSKLIKFNNIFHQKLQDRMKRSSAEKNIIDINRFYLFESEYYYVSIQNFKQYLQGELFYNDFSDFLKEDQNNYNQLCKETKINKLFEEFFSILTYCNVVYDRNMFENLKKHFIEGKNYFEIWKDSPQQIFKNFQKTFKFQNQNYIEIVKTIEFTRNMKYKYKNLQLSLRVINGKNLNEISEQYMQNQNEVKFLINQQIVTEEGTNQIFQYIANQSQNYQLLPQYHRLMVDVFYKIMIEQSGWKTIYFQIYDIIKQKMIKRNNNNNQQNYDSDNEEVLSSDNYLVKSIMSNIEQKIIEYNTQLADFGIILSMIGERCIYYYSIFIIWRFSCYNKWQQLGENNQNQQQMRIEQLRKFIAAIEQNKREQSILFAQALANSLKFVFLEKFYQDQLTNVSDSIQVMNKKSCDLVKFLDQKLLQNYEAAKQKKISDEKILEYILDQKSFISRYVDDEVQKKEEELKKQFQNQLREELYQFLIEIKYNVSLLYFAIQKQTSELKSEKYFEIRDDEINRSAYDQKLYQLIQNCIQGRNFQNFQINPQYAEIFNQQYKIIEVDLFSKLQNDSKKIPLLKPYIEELYKKLELEIKASKNEPLNLGNLQVQKKLNEVKLNMIGCLYTCPMCRRKCDQQPTSEHKHICSNGHQYGGMNGVLIENWPSLFTCEEISDNALITTLETNQILRWKDFKKAYSEWNFQNLNLPQTQQLNEKMMDIWNSGTGQLICNELTKKLKKPIQFEKKTAFNQKKQSLRPTHYILMLDDSYSMEGQPWTNAKNAALSAMQAIQKNGEANVSVIAFNTVARVIIDCQKVDITNQQDLIILQGGLINFNEAFLKAYDQITKHFNRKFERNIILFYIDGIDSFPKQAVDKFCSLGLAQRQTIQLISCAEGDESQNASLQQITDRFTKEQISAELKSNIKVEDLQKVWTEVVIQSYRELKC